VTAPAGAIVKLYLDTGWTVREGDVIQTQTGRAYRVLELRRQERGRHAGRWHLVVVVLAPGELAPDDRIIPIRWYRR